MMCDLVKDRSFYLALQGNFEEVAEKLQ